MLARLLIGSLACLLAWLALRGLLGLLYLGWFAKTGLGSLAREACLARSDQAMLGLLALRGLRLVRSLAELASLTWT